MADMQSTNSVRTQQRFATEKENPRQTRSDAFDQIYPALLGSCASYSSLEYLEALESQITEWLARVREQKCIVAKGKKR